MPFNLEIKSLALCFYLERVREIVREREREQEREREKERETERYFFSQEFVFFVYVSLSFI